MPSQYSIDVRVLVNGKSLLEYPNHQDDDDDENTRTSYVEVTSGQKFTVRVKLLPNFALKHAKHVYAAIQIDDDQAGVWKQSDTITMPHRTGILQDDFEIVASSSLPCWDESRGRWRDADYTFGALGLAESDSASCTLDPRDLASLGCIHIQVYRAEKVKLEHPFVPGGAVPKVVDNVPEKMMKGRSIKNNTKYVFGKDIPAQLPQHYEYVPMTGSAGTVYKFKILYRTRKFLQSAGCIPRTPTPPPDPRLMLDRTEDMLRREKREVARLKAQVANLEAGTHARPSTVASDRPSGAIKRENDTDVARLAGGKRTRDQLEDNDDEPTEVMPPPKKRIEVIDLTED